MTMTSRYTISGLAEQFDITARTIRFYEDEGLLAPERDGTRRIYRERDRVRLRLILRAKRLGFSLAEIRETLELYDSESGEDAQSRYVLRVIDKHRAVLLRQQEDIRQVLEDMAQVEQRILDKIASREQLPPNPN